MPMWMPMMYPRIPTNNMKPPTIYSILESICNFDKDANERTKIRDLARVGRGKIFDFSYPLSSKVDKEEFEKMILNHYMMRRIGFQTLTAFQLQLEVKLNEIMPFYNKLFDSLDGWNIFSDGEKIVRDKDVYGESQAESSLSSESSSEGSNTQDRRTSDMPQSQIDNVQAGKYLSNYDYNQDSNSLSDESSQTGESTGRTSNTEHEEITRTPSDKIEIYKKFQNSIKNIYSMIYKDLDVLFYDIIN